MAFFSLKKNCQCSERCLVWFWPQLTFLHGQRNHRKVPRIAFLFWPGLSPPGSGRTLECTCKRTSSRAHSSAPGRRAPAAGGSLPASCGQRASLTDTWNHESILLVCTFQPSWALILHRKNKSSLCRAESQLEVFSGLVGVEGWILKRVGEEAVHQGAEGYAIFPAGGKVLDVHPLFQSRFMSNTRSRELRCVSVHTLGCLCTCQSPGNTSIFTFWRLQREREQCWRSRRWRLVSSAFVFAHGWKIVALCWGQSSGKRSHLFYPPSFCNVWLVWSCIYLQIRELGSLTLHQELKVLCLLWIFNVLTIWTWSASLGQVSKKRKHLHQGASIHGSYTRATIHPELGRIYLIWFCFGSTPVQKHLFDILSIGYCSRRTYLDRSCRRAGLAVEEKQRSEVAHEATIHADKRGFYLCNFVTLTIKSTFWMKQKFSESSWSRG